MAEISSKLCDICQSAVWTVSRPSPIPKRKGVKLCKGCFQEAEDLADKFEAKKKKRK